MYNLILIFFLIDSNLVNRQTLDIEIIKCNLNKEVALHLLQAVCDSQLSLTVE